MPGSKGVLDRGEADYLSASIGQAEKELRCRRARPGAGGFLTPVTARTELFLGEIAYCRDTLLALFHRLPRLP